MLMSLITLNSLQTLEGPASQGLAAEAMEEEPLEEVPLPADGEINRTFYCISLKSWEGEILCSSVLSDL